MLRAIIFDAYGTLFDVYSVGARAEQWFPGHGVALAQLWRTRQIDYSRLISLSDPHSPEGSRYYKPFREVTRDALQYAAACLRLRLSAEQEQQLMTEYACLPAFSESLPVLTALHPLGMPLAILSNGDSDMLATTIRSAGMTGLFSHVLSACQVRRFKTAPEVYQLGVQALDMPAKDILFVSSNGWDVACAGWFGYTTLWVNRDGQPVEVLAGPPTHTGSNLRDVSTVLKQHGSAESLFSDGWFASDSIFPQTA